jgi:hypothetical protein
MTQKATAKVVLGRLVWGGYFVGDGSGFGFGDELGEDFSQASAGGAAGDPAVVLECLVGGGDGEFLVKDPGAGEPEGFAQLGLGPDGAEHAGARADHRHRLVGQRRRRRGSRR